MNKDISKIIGVGIVFSIGIFLFGYNENNAENLQVEATTLNGNSEKPRNSGFKLDTVLKELAKTEYQKELVDKYIEKTAFSTKQSLSEFDDGLMHEVVYGGFITSQTYCELIAKNLSSNKAYETVKNMYEEIFYNNSYRYTDLEISTMLDYNNTALEVAKEVCSM